ncbi:endo-1,4-beta-xylanase [Pirellulales bacterium]|nr:endo-1,4-beta-xylanase [Pirellulales bacterium]
MHVEFLETRQLLSVTDVGHSSENVADHQAENMSDQIAVTRSVSHSSISQLSSPTRSIPAGGTSLLPDAQPADNFVLGGSASNTAALSVQVNDNQTLPFDNYVRLETPTVPTNVWDINLSLTPLGDLVQDDVVFISFYARGEPSGGATEVQANAYVQENGTNSKLATIPIRGHTQWQYFSTKLEVGSSIDDGGYKFVIHAGFAEQSLEIGGLEIQNYGRLSHRKSDVTIRVVDQRGNPIPDATVDVGMTEHAFRFGTQIRGPLLAVTQAEFDGYTDQKKQGLLPNLTSLGQARYTPTWQDVLNYRSTVIDNFNHIVPGNDLQWQAFNGNGPANPDAAYALAFANGLTAGAVHVVWEKPDWPTPAEYRDGATFNPQDFHDDLIADRLSSTGIMNFYSDSGPGVTITDWNVLNEPLHVTHYSDTFETAGIYASNIEAWADYFVRADVIRPDARLLINDYNILNSASDTATIQYRDLINNLLAAGAPIDRIGLQAHIALNTLTKTDIVRRLDLLAETGLTIEITEFDSRDDAGQLTPVQQEQIFQDMLEAAFEHESVDGFIMWGFWDTGHWRGNAPLYDAAWNTKAEAAPWFDLVHGDWKPNIVGQPVDAAGEWIAPVGLFDGNYEITARLNGRSTTLADVAVNGSGVQIVTIEIQNESPTDITLAGSTVPETASIGTAVGTFETSDPDSGDTFTYSLISGAGSTNNDGFRVSGNALQTNATFVSSGIQSIRVRSTDQGGLSCEQAFTITVSEVDVFNDTPTLDAISDMRINENTSEQIFNLTGITAGNGESQLLRITSISNNSGLISNPVVTYASPNPTGSIVFTPVANQSGTATITVTVEDGGLDNDLGTADDNATVQQTFQITVLDVIADATPAILAKDSAENLYVNTQPVIYQGQPVTQSFFGHTVIGVDTSNSENTLLLQSLLAEGNQPTHRLLSDEIWRINGIFHSLKNAASPILEPSGREVSSIVNVAAVFGAYEISGIKNPTLFVRRGQTYTFHLNTPNHPFYLQTTGNGFQSANAYSGGFSGNGQTSGEYQWVVPQDAPDELFYQCKFHSVMFGKITVMD